ARFPKGQMRFYSRAARLQTVSRVVAEAIASQTPAMKSRTRVIPYPLIGSGSDPSESKRSKEKRILFVGRVHPEKGVQLMIRVFAAVPREKLDGWNLDIVGPAETRFGGGGARYLRELNVLSELVEDRVNGVGG